MNHEIKAIRELIRTGEKIFDQPIRYYLTFILVITFFRAAFIPTMGLMPQDAYYYFYSEHLSLSYYDHPPMIAYLLKLFSILGKSVWVVKLTSFVTASFILVSFYILSRRIWDIKHSVLTTALFSSTVMMSILSVLSGPDLPLVLFWIWAMIFAHRSVQNNKAIDWILTGLFMGLSFDGKYTGILLPGCLFLYLIFFRKELLKRIWPYVGMLIMALTIAPVFYWNYIHDFASFTYQSTTRANVIAEDHWKPTHLLGSIAQQSVVVGPVIFFVLSFVVYQFFIKNWKRIKGNQDTLFLLAFYIPVFSLFMGISLIYWVKLNWFMPAYIAGFLLLPHVLKKSWVIWQFRVSVFLHVLLAIQVWLYPINIQSDDTWYGWDQLAEVVEDYQELYPSAFVVAGDHYKTTAELMFYMDQKVYGENVFGKRSVHFDYIGDHLPDLNGMDAIYVDSDTRFKDLEKGRELPPEVKKSFEQCVELNPAIIQSGGKAVRKFNIFYCKNYTWSLYEPVTK